MDAAKKVPSTGVVIGWSLDLNRDGLAADPVATSLPADPQIGRRHCPLQTSKETFGGGCGTAFSDRSMALSHRANDGRKTELGHAIELKATPGKQLGRTDQGRTRQLPRTICDDFLAVTARVWYWAWAKTRKVD
jgi:hypothetical protein